MTSWAETLSLTGKKWRLNNHLWPQGAALAQTSGLPPVVAQILVHRGVDEINLAEAFLNPRLETLPDPMTLKDMDAAVAVLDDALREGTRIAIFGDYDVDGTCATSLLTRYLRALGTEPLRYIPDRLTEGYGLNDEAMRTLKAQGVGLLITVDTGIMGHAALEEAARLGLKVLVTDHHPQHGELPKAAAIVNPNRADDVSELGDLCGTGVAFYVAMALNRHLRANGFFNAERPEPKLAPLLDVVALATVCDVMPLVGPNRLLVSKGLQQLATWRHRGLATLASVAGVKDAPTSHTLGFALGPRLNAAGRIDSALAALNLLLCDDDVAAMPLATTLNNLNRQRQEMEKATVEEALATVTANPHDPVVVVANPAWHPGVVGLVASRLKDRLGRLVFVLGGTDDGLLKGSGRGVEGFDLGAAVAACADITLSGGGHAMAAGVTLHPAQVEAFRQRLNDHVRGQIATAYPHATEQPLTHILAPTLALEAEVIPASLTPALARTLDQLAPFGNGNTEPTLALNKAHVAYARPVGAAEEHLKLRLAGTDGSAVDAIAFGANRTELGPVLMGKVPATNLVLAGHVRLSTFGGRERVDFQVVDGRVGGG